MKPDNYLPVPWDFREMLDEAMRQKAQGQIHYFSSDAEAGPSGGVGRSDGSIKELCREARSEFLITGRGDRIRLDKIITLFGKPGPAFDDYERFGNACMACFDDDDDDDR